MNEQLFNQDWYKVADLKVRLKDHAVIHRHLYRGKVMYVLQDHITGQFHRFTPETHQIIGLMDGRRSLQQIWELACENSGDNMPTQNDIIGLVTRLYQANVIVTDRIPDIRDLDVRRRRFNRKRILQQLKSPLSIKIPLLDPEKFLSRTMPLMDPLFSKTAALVWLLVVLAGLVTFLVHFESVTGNISDRVLALNNLVLIGLTYPFVKIIHELGHAYSVKRWGGEVHEIGVMMLVFFPVPYVDATASTAFGNKYHRMLVGAAGILVELFLAASAMILWTLVEEGVVRSVLFNIMLVSGVSTLLFNGNPLLRFDAYYVLADFLEIPNLSIRSNQYFGHCVGTALFRIPDMVNPAASRSEAIWLMLYAVVSFLYRLFITIAIILFVGSKYFIFGTLMAIWFLYMAFVQPLASNVLKPVTNPALTAHRQRIYLTGGTLAGVILLLVLFMPVPLSTRAEGVVWVPEQARIYSEESGFIRQAPELSDRQVHPGQVVFRMENPDLEMQLRVLEQELNESRARYEATLDNTNLAEVLREDYQYVKSQYDRAGDRYDHLQVRARAEGRLLVADPENMAGRYFHRGELLGYVYNDRGMPVNVMIPDIEVEKVLNDTQSVEVRYVSRMGQVYGGEISRIAPSAGSTLVSPVLSVDGGGDIALRPSEGGGTVTLEKYFQVEIRVPEATGPLVDERVYLLFRHTPEAVYKRWYRGIRRIFLRTFSV